MFVQKLQVRITPVVTLDLKRIALVVILECGHPLPVSIGELIRCRTLIGSASLFGVTCSHFDYSTMHERLAGHEHDQREAR